MDINFNAILIINIIYDNRFLGSIEFIVLGYDELVSMIVYNIMIEWNLCRVIFIFHSVL